MLEAMQSAKVGDDVFGDDPTINELEQFAAELFGMEASLFCPSGTMTNQIAIRVHTRPGDEVICDQLAHIYNYEGGGIASNSGASVRLLNGDRGRFTAEDAKNAIMPDDPHNPNSRLVSVENTSNKGGGALWNMKAMMEIKSVCVEYDLAYHLDGARLFNALAETNEDPKSYGELFDSISICLSKGLGAPVGSLLLGSKSFIHQARRVRKVFGGGMRQAGYLAAAGLYALKNHRDRLKEDHARAKVLEKSLNDLSWVDSVLPVESNIVVAKLRNDVNEKMLVEALKEEGVLIVPFGRGHIRFVTHLDIDDNRLEYCLDVLKEINL